MAAHSITLQNIGKRFQREWIFRGVNHVFHANHAVAITGPNGSGKSTLIQLIAAATLPAEGKASYLIAGKPVKPEDIYSHVSLAAPYLELPEELSLAELITFHFSFKKPLPGVEVQAIPAMLKLDAQVNKPISQYSSGMKARVKLGLALFSHTPIVLLDEPTANMDADNSAWYLHQVERFKQDRIFIVSSNQPHEYGFCETVLRIEDYK